MTLRHIPESDVPASARKGLGFGIGNFRPGYLWFRCEDMTLPIVDPGGAEYSHLADYLEAVGLWDQHPGMTPPPDGYFSAVVKGEDAQYVRVMYVQGHADPAAIIRYMESLPNPEPYQPGTSQS